MLQYGLKGEPEPKLPVVRADGVAHRVLRDRDKCPWQPAQIRTDRSTETDGSVLLFDRNTVSHTAVLSDCLIRAMNVRVSQLRVSAVTLRTAGWVHPQKGADDGIVVWMGHLSSFRCELKMTGQMVAGCPTWDQSIAPSMSSPNRDMAVAADEFAVVFAESASRRVPCRKALGGFKPWCFIAHDGMVGASNAARGRAVDDSD